MHRGNVVRGVDGHLTDGKRVVRYGDLVRVKDGRIGIVVFTRVSVVDQFKKPTYRPQVMVEFAESGPYNETFPFRFVRALFPEDGRPSASKRKSRAKPKPPGYRTKNRGF